MTRADKLLKLQNILKKMGSVLVGFSGGVDSTFLATVVGKTLKDKSIAATVLSDFLPVSERKEVFRWERSLN